NDNVCRVNGSAYGTNLGKGIQQTNPGLGIYITNNNIFQVSAYVFEFSGTPAAGSDFNNDCLQSSDPTRFFEWNNVRYGTLAGFQAATGQELAGRLGPC